MPRALVHRGRKIEVLLDTTVLPDGTTIRRDMILHPGAVVIHHPIVDAGHVCLLKNYRFIVDETLWELPAGTLEPGEPPDRAAERELAEETGYTAGHWQKLTTAFASPGCLSELMHIFVATDLTPGTSRGRRRTNRWNRKIITWDQALAWAMDGTILDIKTIAGLLMW